MAGGPAFTMGKDAAVERRGYTATVSRVPPDSEPADSRKAEGSACVPQSPDFRRR